MHKTGPFTNSGVSKFVWLISFHIYRPVPARVTFFSLCLGGPSDYQRLRALDHEHVRNCPENVDNGGLPYGRIGQFHAHHLRRNETEVRIRRYALARCPGPCHSAAGCDRAAPHLRGLPGGGDIDLGPELDAIAESQAPAQPHRHAILRDIAVDSES